MACRSSFVCIVLTILVMNFWALRCQAQLSSENFYNRRCPSALSTIRAAISAAVSRERRMAASLIRLHFHDCFVQGCDGSVLLDDTASMIGEKNSLNNANSIRGFDVIENVKAQLESRCPGVVSCADILALAARDASVAVGGPSWAVKLGRRDSTSASPDVADQNLPRFTNTLSELISLFNRKNLNQRDMVALSGAHTIGQARCFSFRARVNSNESDIEAGFARKLREELPCPADGSGNANLAPLDSVTPNTFDNSYYRNLVDRKGLLQSDQGLFSGGSTDSIVNEYVKDGSIFRSNFASAMQKMGDLDPLTGSAGEIRRFCNVVN